MINNNKNKTSPRQASTAPTQITVKITNLHRSSSNKGYKLANPNIWIASLDGKRKIRIIYFHGQLQIEMETCKTGSISTSLIAKFSPHYAVEIEKLRLAGLKQKDASLRIQQKGIHNFEENTITHESGSKNKEISDELLLCWLRLHRKHYQLLSLRGVAGCKASFETAPSPHRGRAI